MSPVTYVDTRTILITAYVLITSVTLGIVSDLVFLFPSEIWVIWYLIHMSILAFMVLLGEKQLILMYDFDRIIYVCLNVATICWYLNRIEMTNPKSGGYVDNCNHDMMLISSLISTYVLLFSVIVIFISLFFF
tara:strand:- start:1221 stop:1619 length:399 start_codon:yes stop_codon:yes gene_type:complete